MIRLRVDINGRDIAAIGIWNTQQYDDAGDLCYQVHDIRGYDAHGGHIEDYPHIENVWMDPDAGPSEVIERCLVPVDGAYYDY